MSTLTDQLLQQLGSGRLSQISQQIGADEASTGSALDEIFGFLRRLFGSR